MPGLPKLNSISSVGGVSQVAEGQVRQEPIAGPVAEVNHDSNSTINQFNSLVLSFDSLEALVARMRSGDFIPVDLPEVSKAQDEILSSLESFESDDVCSRKETLKQLLAIDDPSALSAHVINLIFDRPIINHQDVIDAKSFFQEAKLDLSYGGLRQRTMRWRGNFPGEDLIPYSYNSNRPLPRRHGLQRALGIYFQRISREEPKLYGFCSSVAARLFDMRPMSPDIEMITPIIGAADEDYARLLREIEKQNFDHRKNEIVLFINGSVSADQTQVGLADRVAEIERFLKHHPSLNVRVVASPINEFRYGLKTIPIMIGLLLARYAEIDHDITVNNFDADIVRFANLNVMKDKHESIQSGHTLCYSHVYEDPSILRNNHTLYLADYIYNLFEDHFSKYQPRNGIFEGSLNLYHFGRGRTEKTYSDISYLMTPDFYGCNNAYSAMIYALCDGVATELDHGADNELRLKFKQHANVTPGPGNYFFFDRVPAIAFMDGEAAMRVYSQEKFIPQYCRFDPIAKEIKDDHRSIKKDVMVDTKRLEQEISYLLLAHLRKCWHSLAAIEGSKPRFAIKNKLHYMREFAKSMRRVLTDKLGVSIYIDVDDFTLDHFEHRVSFDAGLARCKSIDYKELSEESYLPKVTIDGTIDMNHVERNRTLAV